MNWTHNADAVAYEIYNVTSSVAYVDTVAAPTATYSLSGLSAGTTYKYRVRAKIQSGTMETNTNDVSFTTLLQKPSGLSLQSPSSSPNDDTTPTIRVNGVSSGQTVKLYSDSSCSTEMGSATASATTVDITTSTLSDGVSYTFYAKVFNEQNNNSPCSTANVAYATGLTCPTGFVAVPANSSLGVSAFCVMKYEARNDGSGNAISQEAGTPWGNTSLSQSKSYCTAIGAKYDLISNPEWMTLAHNIEGQSANWSSGSVGAGCLMRGNVGLVDNCSYDASSDPEYGSGRNIKAKHVLSNGNEIWDIGGNVWEWVDWTLGGSVALGPTSCSDSWTELPDVSCGALANADYMPSNPSGVTASSYNSNYALGNFLGGTGGTGMRSSGWGASTNSGIYAIWLRDAPGATYPSVGFRCVYRP